MLRSNEIAEYSRNRHLPYCRRSQNRQRTRQKSCQACSIAKTKCSAGEKCSRCSSRGLNCIYDDSRRIRGPCSSKSKASPMSSNLPKNLNEEFVAGDNSGLENDSSDWAMTIENAAFLADAWETQHPFASEPNNTIASIIDSDIDSPRCHEIYREPVVLQDTLPTGLPSLSQPQKMFGFDWSLYSAELSIPMTVSRQQNACVLKPYLLQDAVAQHSAKYIVQTLRAYPRMMLRKSTFPPFIHPHWHGHLPAPLANCMSIAQMFSTRTADTSPFVWRTIMMEQQRLANEVSAIFIDPTLVYACRLMFISLVQGPAEGRTTCCNTSLHDICYNED